MSCRLPHNPTTIPPTPTYPTSPHAPPPNTDTWVLYLTTPFAHRAALLSTLPPAKKELIGGKELCRVRYLREYFSPHRLSLSTLPIGAALEHSHARWRARGVARCHAELARPDAAILDRVRALTEPRPPAGGGDDRGRG
ncbi:hypothetical protein B0T18DRAFT_427755 [Schizothecium vesticola]|uniref:Uncharacterized protein n=1 Tax=Schizothecium vesticola TaxID=314040 RepID=A0AA40F1U5_9PEZI|nr:hypothetical protein B0T18DRAFT_427755 [Schizothecium vesticola]